MTWKALFEEDKLLIYYDSAVYTVLGPERCLFPDVRSKVIDKVENYVKHAGKACFLVSIEATVRIRSMSSGQVVVALKDVDPLEAWYKILSIIRIK